MGRGPALATATLPGHGEQPAHASPGLGQAPGTSVAHGHPLGTSRGRGHPARMWAPPLGTWAPMGHLTATEACSLLPQVPRRMDSSTPLHRCLSCCQSAGPRSSWSCTGS